MSLRRKPLMLALILMFVSGHFMGHTLTCDPAEYQVNNDCCPKCPAGSRVKTDCTKFRSTSCQPCVKETFLDEPNGSTRCSDCKICDPNSGLTVKRTCTATSDTVCGPRDGFRCVNFTDGSCTAGKEHKSCEPGQYISQKGTATTDTVCSSCSDGTFSDGTATSCQQHTQCEASNQQLIKAGTASADAECGDTSPSRLAIFLNVNSGVWLVVSFVFIVIFYKRKCKDYRANCRGCCTSL